jgi:hypothetical protein
MRCPKCNGTDHAKASSSKCSQCVKQKAKAFKEFSKTSIIKISLAKTCKNSKFVEEIRELIAHITQVVYAGSIFANYIYLNEVQIIHTSEPVSHNLIYQFFSVLTGQGKKATDKIKISFQSFCNVIPELKLKEYKGKSFQSVIAPAATSYESLVRNQVSYTFERKTLRYFLNSFSRPGYPIYC